MFRRAVWGGVLLVPTVAVLLLCSALMCEFPAPAVLPSWLDWARGFLTVALVWLGVVLGIFAIVLIERPSELRRELAFRGFAAARGLNFARYGTAPPARGLAFAEGSDAAASRGAKNRAKGIAPDPSESSRFRAHFALSEPNGAGEPELQLAIAGYTGGKNDPRGPRSAFRYLQLRLPRALPHLMIDARRNGRLRQFLPGTQRLSLEGDFDSHFATYVPAGYERDALELLTPDVMASLIDHGRRWDVEVVENQMIVVSGRIRRRYDRAETTALLRFAELVGGELAHQAQSYSDPRARHPRSQVADPGQRLRRRSGAWATAIGAAVVAAMLGFPFVLGWFLDR